MALDSQAKELNDIIESVNAHIFSMLSMRGKEIYFPKKGILGQTADAQHCSINATIGAALEDDNTTMFLPSLGNNILLPPKDVFSYAKGPGKPELRIKWKELLVAKNPSLVSSEISLPVVTVALTHGLSMAGYLFADTDDEIIIPDLFWGNYRLILEKAWYGRIVTFKTFTDEGGFNTEGLRERLTQGNTNKKIVILNFPNNPTGYTLTIKEAQQIRDSIISAAETGSKIVVIVDDAYFGLVYEPGIITESIFTGLCNAHQSILAIKLDGPTKEDYVWGFRVGFITFGSKKNSPELYQALEAKCAGAIRGSVSNASHIAQSLLLKAYSSATYEAEKREKFKTLRRRYLQVRSILSLRTEFRQIFTPLPFNSGYFMCVELAKGLDADKLRQHLIAKYDTGVISQGAFLRIAFSSTPIHLLEKLFENIYHAGKELLGS